MRGKRSDDCDIDLGLAVSACLLQPGETRSFRDLAAFCGCSPAAIQSIEGKAMRKIKRKLNMCKDPVLLELLEHYKG